jgi:hypothetical protein
MSSTTKSILWWVFAVFFTIAAAEYQKMTGPTYPVKGHATLNGKEIKYKLIRTAENDKDAEISVVVPDQSVTGFIEYKRYKSHDSLTSVPMTRSGEKLVFMMPKQPAAGKMSYDIVLNSGTESVKLTNNEEKPVVMRFKGPVPLYILIPHVLCMFLGLLFSTRTAIESLINGARTYKLALFALFFLIPGGLILGPFVQKYAFGHFWTGWPIADGVHFNITKFGDLTDNKTFVMFLAWLIAAYKLRKDPGNKVWPVAAAIIVLIVYLIPHSVLGSEIDYTKLPAK